MALKYRTEGFIFKKEDRSDSDQSFSVFTRDFGRVELRGRAIRKITSKLRSNIDIFFISKIEFIQGKHHKTLTDAIKIRKGNICDTRQAETLLQMADTLDSFIKGQEKDEVIFNLICSTLDKMEEHHKLKNDNLLYQYFLWNFLSAQGYHLQADSCAGCQGKLNPEGLFFSTREGGVLCQDCAKMKNVCREVNADVVKTLRLILQKDWGTISKLKIGAGSQSILSNIATNCFNAYCPAHN